MNAHLRTAARGGPRAGLRRGRRGRGGGCRHRRRRGRLRRWRGGGGRGRRGRRRGRAGSRVRRRGQHRTHRNKQQAHPQTSKCLSVSSTPACPSALDGDAPRVTTSRASHASCPDVSGQRLGTGLFRGCICYLRQADPRPGLFENPACCYSVFTGGGVSPREVPLSPRGPDPRPLIRGGQGRPRGEMMSEPTFRGLGASAPVADVLAAQGIETPFEIQGRVLPDALAGQDVLAKAPTGSGKTLAFGIPLVERVDPAGPRLPRWCWSRPASWPPRWGRCWSPWQLHAACGWPPPTAESASATRPRGRSAHLLVATPGRLEDLATARCFARRRDDAGAGRGRPDARHGLPAPGRPDRAAAAAGVRRCSSRPRWTARSGRLRAATRPTRPTTRQPADETVQEVDHRFVQVTPETKVQTLIDC